MYVRRIKTVAKLIDEECRERRLHTFHVHHNCPEICYYTKTKILDPRAKLSLKTVTNRLCQRNRAAFAITAKSQRAQTSVAAGPEVDAGAVAVAVVGAAGGAPGRGVSQAAHLTAVWALLIMHSEQLQEPAAGLNFSHRAEEERNDGIGLLPPGT